MEKKKPVREAAALQYDKEKTPVPVVTALGRGLVADKIIETARENNVPVVSDALLAQVLNKLSVGDEIPREFYAIVAQTLVMVSRMDREYGEKLSRQANPQEEPEKGAANRQ